MVNIEKTIREINANSARMEDMAATAARLSNQYGAHMTLYNVAATTSDKETMDKERQTLHDLLDHLLDVGSQIGVGQAELTALIRSAQL